MINEYFANLQSRLAASIHVGHIRLLRLEIDDIEGYIRLRGTLVNGDTFEISEYVMFRQDSLEVVRYNYQRKFNC